MYCLKVLLKSYKVRVKKKLVKSIVHGLFYWEKVGKVKLDLTWILQLSGSMTIGIRKFDFCSVKRVEFAKRCRFFVAGLFPLWYHDSG